MSGIYQPKGKAREYSPLALNIYKGCDHNCFYCYVPKMNKRFNPDYKHGEVTVSDKFFTDFIKSAEHYKGTDKQVLLSFTSDPYCEESEWGTTNVVIETLLDCYIPTAILSKGGARVLRDIYLFKKFPKQSLKVGTSLTYDNDTDSMKYESGAAPFTQRLTMLKYLHEAGIQTWVSIEPVLDAEQSLNCIKESLLYTDHYKIGKLNHYPALESRIDWGKFLKDVVHLLRHNGKPFYIKKDLQQYIDGTVKLLEHETDQDFLNVKKFERLEPLSEKKREILLRADWDALLLNENQKDKYIKTFNEGETK